MWQQNRRRRRRRPATPMQWALGTANVPQSIAHFVIDRKSKIPMTGSCIAEFRARWSLEIIEIFSQRPIWNPSLNGFERRPQKRNQRFLLQCAGHVRSNVMWWRRRRLWHLTPTRNNITKDRWPYIDDVAAHSWAIALTVSEMCWRAYCHKCECQRHIKHRGDAKSAKRYEQKYRKMNKKKKKFQDFYGECRGIMWMPWIRWWNIQQEPVQCTVYTRRVRRWRHFMQYLAVVRCTLHHDVVVDSKYAHAKNKWNQLIASKDVACVRCALSVVCNVPLQSAAAKLCTLIFLWFFFVSFCFATDCIEHSSAGTFAWHWRP